MNKRILPLILSVIICFAMFCPLRVSAVTPLDPNADASLTLHYQKNDVGFADLQIGIFRVAEAFPDGSFQLVEPFASYPIDIHGITTQEQWYQVAQTLYSYIVTNQLSADYELLTDEKGDVCFSDLSTGLYFVREVTAESTDGTYIFNQFMVYVPTPQADGTYTYDVEANPKCAHYVPKEDYHITILWKDCGKENSRPKEVKVNIYKDGKLYETKILKENDWNYTWRVPDGEEGNWTVGVDTVPDNYKVTIQQNGNKFTIIYACQGIKEPPKTGDSFSPLLWMIVLCISGIVMMILGFSRRRHK